MAVELTEHAVEHGVLNLIPVDGLPEELDRALGDYIIMFRSHWSRRTPLELHSKQEKVPCANFVG